MILFLALFLYLFLTLVLVRIQTLTLTMPLALALVVALRLLLTLALLLALGLALSLILAPTLTLLQAPLSALASVLLCADDIGSGEGGGPAGSPSRHHSISDLQTKRVMQSGKFWRLVRSVVSEGYIRSRTEKPRTYTGFRLGTIHFRYISR